MANTAFWYPYATIAGKMRPVPAELTGNKVLYPAFRPTPEVPRSSRRSSRIPVVAIAGLAVLAPALGGGTQLWAEAVLLAGLALLLVIAPPRRGPGVIFTALLTAVCLLGVTAFLPAQWLPQPAWRQSLQAAHPVELGTRFSPQIWLSAEAFCLLVAGCILAGYLFSVDWNEKSLRRAMVIYAGGVTALAVVALGCFLTHHKVPFWPRTPNSPIDFGFFPNRNQTANVLALAGIASTALAFDAFRRQRGFAWAWIGAVLILGIALVIDYSRAGIIIFSIGVAGWLLLAFALSSSRKGLALGLAGIALLLTLFFLFGGETLQRFQNLAPQKGSDFRLSIHADAWRLAATAPWLGQGLGNFEPIFALARDASAERNRALHPESDWLWMAVEMGWPAVGLLFGAFLLWVKQSVPFESGSERFLRSAALMCGAAFALHGLVDVSGHRLGALWPALFLGSLAMRPRRPDSPSALAAVGFRGLGLVLGLISFWWIGSLVSSSVSHRAPTSAQASRLLERLEKETTEAKFTEAVATADEAMVIAPLDWRIYYQRGIARMATSPVPWPADRDFQTARYLEPRWVDSCFNEGKMWLAIDQTDLALAAWTETLRRAGDDAPALYSEMLALAGKRFTLHAALQDLAQSDRRLLLAFLHFADRLECDTSIGRLLDNDPNLEGLTSEERRAVFHAWFDRGDRALLVSRLRETPGWLADGWFLLAHDYAEHQEFQEAYQLARELGPSPALPKLKLEKPLSVLEQQFRFHPHNFQEGLELYFGQQQTGRMEDAVTTLTALEALPEHPAYISFLQAEARAGLGDWENAWTAWLRYGGDRF